MSVVCPASELSIFDSSSSLIEMPTDVGANEHPAAKPYGKKEFALSELAKRAPTARKPTMMGSPVPAIATTSAFLPTDATLSKWMCMPDSMIINVTPTLPMNV